MCGIVGMAFADRNGGPQRAHTDIQKLRKQFTEMLVECQDRGSAATGVMISYLDWNSNRKNKVRVLKAPLPAEEFVKMDTYKQLLDKVDMDMHFIVGHTRAVTQGDAKNNRNNHPHRAGKIIGVHNGAIKNFKALWDKCKADGLAPTGTCDSEAICAIVEKYRIEGKTMPEALDKAMKEMQGWYAVALMDTRKPTQLVWAKDDDTPLHLGWLPTLRVGLLSSEKAYVSAALDKSDQKYASLEWMDTPKNSIGVFDCAEKVGNQVPLTTHIVDVNVYKRTKEDEKLHQTTQGVSEGSDPGDEDHGRVWRSNT